MPEQDDPTPPREGLFGPEDDAADAAPAADAGGPLAARMRPRALDEFAGQSGVMGPGTLLRGAIERDQLSSIVLWGPPGCGKSTLARIIARSTRAAFEEYSAVTSGVADIRKVIERARERRRQLGRRTILFIDEIHRWNKSQQDALLPHVEDGTVVLIGATTENPYFEVNAPLLSRSRLFRLEALADHEVRGLLLRALEDSERGLGGRGLQVDPEALEHLVAMSGGDARNALSALEAAAAAAMAGGSDGPRVTLALAEEGAQERRLGYDRAGDEHYDTISAFIKSVRGSDPDAAIYWLAKMLLAGEDPKFVARRLVILASEDVGNADPQGLVVASAAAQAVQFVGMPEAQLTLAQATAYLACAPKSNAATIAIGRAAEEIRAHGAAPVPSHLRGTGYAGAERLGHGKGYVYPHDHPGHYVRQRYLPEGVGGLPYYEPTEEGHEARTARRMEERRRGVEGPGDAPK